MYLVLDKKSRKILHVNPAPAEQELAGQDVYHLFDPAEMEILVELDESPGRFRNDAGAIVEPGEQEMLEAGLSWTAPEAPVEREPTLAEKIAAGSVNLAPDEKLADDGKGGQRIVPKSLRELVEDGQIVLEKTQKVVEEAGEERVVDKTVDEQLSEGLLTLEEAKARRREEFSRQALLSRHEILPDYKLQNAALGIYDEETVARFRATVQAFRAEVHRLEQRLDAVKSASELQKIRAKFPDRILSGAS